MTARAALPSGLALLSALAVAIGAALADIPELEFAKPAAAFRTSTEPEACTSCHFALAPPAPPGPGPGGGGAGAAPEARDVVVVGGGLAGLTAAWHLRDADVLVLEKEARAGGKMKRGEWSGVRYSKGPAYLAAPEGDVKALLDAVGLAPVKVREPANALALGPGRVVLDPWRRGIGELPFPDAARRRIRAAFEAIEARGDEVSLPAWESPKSLLALDERKASEWLDELGGPELVRLVEPYVRSCFAAPSEDVSALAVVCFLAFEFDDTYSFPGGLAALPEALEARLGDRVRRGAFVTAVEATKDGGVTVAYRDAAGAERRVVARAAVVACSQSVAKHLVAGLPEERRDLMASVYHGAYAVAALKTTRPVHDGAYDTWLLDSPVTDIIVADWVAGGDAPGPGPGPRGAPRPAVLSVYMPLHTSGRGDLLEMPADDVKARLLEPVAAFIPAIREEGTVAGVDLFLHGHAMHVPYPGYLTTVAPRLAEPLFARIFFAGVELDLPSLESAVWSGVRAARAAKRALGAAAAPR